MTTDSSLNTPLVAVLVCTYNGERFLTKQLDSIIHQSIGAPLLLISDDGSSDNTLQIIEHYKTTHPAVTIHIMQGPRKGFQYNFLSLFSLQTPPAQYMAFADQDDIWEHDKLEHALNALKQYPADQPALYGTRTRLIDKHEQEIGFSPLFTKLPSFANALVQSLCGGNTMVINQASWKILTTLPQTNIVSHDWSIYQVISGVGGHVIYDPYPSLRYRQHENNIIGANTSFIARLVRINMLLQNRFKHWNTANLATLQPIADTFTPSNQTILESFIQARQSSFIQRIILFKKSGLYRQTRLGMIGLWAAIILGKC